jgi:hypothetical protein
MAVEMSMMVFWVIKSFGLQVDTNVPPKLWYLRTSPHDVIGLNGKFLRFRRDGVSISYTVICLSQFEVCIAIT